MTKLPEEELQDVAEQLYSLTDNATAWNTLSEAKQRPYLHQARHLIDGEAEIFGALVAKYCVGFGMPEKYKNILSAIIGVILGALSGLVLMGCTGQTGYSGVITPEATTVCKDGTCITVTKDGVLSWSQESPEPTETVAPVVQKTTK